MDRIQNGGHRNFIGAAVGGFIGLLSLAYFGKLMMLVACFAGVIVGFWYRELWSSLRHADWPSTGEMKKELQDTTQLFQSFASDFWKAVGRPFHWLRKHPMNVVMTVRAVNRILGFALFIFVTAIASRPFAQQESLFGTSLFLAAITLPSFGFVLGIFMPSMVNLKEQTLKDFYTEYELFSRQGVLRFMVRDLALVVAKFTKAMFALAIAAVAIPLWSIGFSCTVLLPLGGLVSFLRVFWWAATRRKHWPCLLVTIATTATTGWLLGPWLEQERLRWVAALINGLLCGALAEVAVWAMAAWQDRSKWYQAYVHVSLKRRLGYYHNLWLPTLRFFLKPVMSLGPAL